MKARIKYIALVTILVSLSLVIIYFVYQLGRYSMSPNVSPQSPTEISSESTEADSGLDSKQFQWLKEMYINDWEDMYTTIYDYCIKNDIDANSLVCESTDLEFTDDFKPYVYISTNKGKLRLLFDSSTEPVSVEITMVTTGE